MKLYQEIPDNEVLEQVIELVEKSAQSLLVAANELENSSVTPDERYFKALQKAANRGVKITRYYYGSKEAHHQEELRNPHICCLYAGPSEGYQRAVIVDGKKSMSKINNHFVYSENTQWIEDLQKHYASK